MLILLRSKKGSATEIIEPSERISSESIANMLSILNNKFKNLKVSGLAAMGSTPPGCPADLYSKIIEETCNNRSKILLDTVTGLASTLAVCREIGCTVMLKVNARELCSIAGVDIRAILDKSESSMPVPVELIREAAVNMFRDMEGLQHIAITDGPFPAYFFNLLGYSFWTISPVGMHCAYRHTILHTLFFIIFIIIYFTHLLSSSFTSHTYPFDT